MCRIAGGRPIDKICYRCSVYTYSFVMGRRRHIPRPLDAMRGISKQDYWVVIKDPWNNLIESRHLPIGTDLLLVYLQLLTHYHTTGWQIVEFGSFNCEFYATKEGERKRYIQITTMDPAGPPPNIWAGSFNPKS
jgi:hypothetical protein